MVIKKDYESFFKDNQTFLYRVIRGYVRDRAVAEDLVIEAFMKVYNRWEKIQAMDNPVGYLVRVGINEAKSYLVKKKNIPVADEYETQVIAPQSTPEVRALIEEENRWVETQLAGLKDMEKDIIIMKDIDKKKFHEIADILQQKLPTVKSHYRRAKLKISEQMEKEYAV